MPAPRPPDHLCGLGYSPSNPRRSAAEGKVCHHAERLLNMVHAYCDIRDSWTGWVRGAAMGRTLYQRIIPEMRALELAERRIIDKPSVCLLAVLDYSGRARQAVPEYTPRTRIDYPQPPLADAVRGDRDSAGADAFCRDGAEVPIDVVGAGELAHARALKLVDDVRVVDDLAGAGDRALRGRLALHHLDGAAHPHAEAHLARTNDSGHRRLRRRAARASRNKYRAERARRAASGR